MLIVTPTTLSSEEIAWEGELRPLAAELRAFGRILNDILAGNRQPDLSDLPPSLATAMQQLLTQL